MKFLTVADVCALLNVKPSWIYQRINAGTLPFAHTKVEHFVRFKREDIESYLERQTVAANSGRER
jgi:excisionase family DNA binding protein